MVHLKWFNENGPTGLLRPRPIDGTLSENGIRERGGSSPDLRRPADVYLPRWPDEKVHFRNDAGVFASFANYWPR